jgi:CheY-like chemotaxis protein
MTRRVLWADDEIELLRPHILILEKQGYEVAGVSNGLDALERVKGGSWDLVLLDEMMPGMSGLDTLKEIKRLDPALPCVMVTKSESESLMDQAIGRQIDDYLTKPVNPSQIIAVCKRIIERQRLTGRNMSESYMQGLAQIGRQLAAGADWRDFLEIHQQLCAWELELDERPELGFAQTLADQRRECNREFARLVERRYLDWIHKPGGPMMSPGVVKGVVVPLLREKRPVLFCVIDCMRMDHWMVLERTLREKWRVRREQQVSILPSATPYARNAIFAGMYPADIAKAHPEYWERNMDDEGNTNRHERQFLDHQLRLNGIEFKPAHKYIKVIDLAEANDTLRKVDNLFNHQFVSMVWNFVDILAHSRNQNDIVREMVPDEAAYRSVVSAWFRHSALFQILESFREKGYTVVITSDHGSVRVQRGARIFSDRDATRGLRWKLGRNLRLEDDRSGIFVDKPETWRLPHGKVSETIAFAVEDQMFLYGNNYNHYLAQFKDSFQHGGISLEEMVLPVAVLEPR